MWTLSQIKERLAYDIMGIEEAIAWCDDLLAQEQIVGDELCKVMLLKASLVRKQCMDGVALELYARVLQNSNDDQDKLHAADCSAQIHFSHGDLDSAMSLRGLRWWRNQEGECSVNYAKLLHHMADKFASTKRQHEIAIEWYDFALSALQRCDNSEKDCEHHQLETARVYLGKAKALHTLGKKHEASELCQLSVNIQRKILGEHDESLSDALLEAANILQDAEEYLEANNAVDHALQIRRRTLGATHPDTMKVMQSYHTRKRSTLC